MMETRYYKVADHVFGVSGEADSFALMSNYEPFETRGKGSSVFMLSLNTKEPSRVVPLFVEEMRQEDEGQEIVCGKTADGEHVFEFRWWNETAGWLICSEDYRDGRLIATGKYEKMAIDNALMVLFALATADKGTVLFHAAVVSHEGRGYMFLGPSGTGKSTHARLWLKHIQGTELVNDDNPVVRDGVVYGSPWSGKTPCYRNVNYPLGGIVLLSQAPYNKITRLDGLQAYAALVSSISGKRWDERIADGLHATENALVSTVPMWHLDCLPDEEAARVCRAALAPDIVEETVRLVEDGVSVTLPVSGHSMLPFIIGGKESVILQRPKESKIGDVVLAWVEGKRYVVHRIIRIDGENVTLMGDGNLVGTERCTLSDIKAVATHVVGADEKLHDLYTPWLRRAAKLWWHLRPIRRYLLAIYKRL